MAFVFLFLGVGCSAPIESTQPASADITSPATIITMDGSSTVYPISEEMALEYLFEKGDDSVVINVDFSGTSSGFRKFCAGEIDISNASRPITREEMTTCKEAGIEYIELPVAFDALTVAVHPDNDWADDITIDELKMLWEPAAEGQITQWSQIRSDWPNEPINLYGAGSDSGTFDYFTEAIVGESGASREDYTASEDDTELVRGVRIDPNSLGYFGYAYYEESQAALKALGINNGEGPIVPSDDMVRSGEYQPLTRPLFIYVSVDALEEKPELEEFVNYYLIHARYIVPVAGYTALPEEGYKLVLSHLIDRKVGTVFDGEARFDLTIEELLQKEAEF
ncbi:MAG: PstS family phosphate ABC transporter substrate-binding protein [Leptolyngbyaceae bacterium]|nr:PstS family phosphate ABC transporter substrate-binding protein [Leptolyngbyaceae bacterium]